MRQPDIKQTREGFVARQSPGIRGFFETYFKRLDRQFREYQHKRYPWTHLASWRVLPVMLADRYRVDARREALPRGFHRDVRWGQYCLYLCLRFQDDFFDGQSSSPVAVYASDQCLVEAERIFSRYFTRDSWFWRIYLDGIRVTTQSIVEVDLMQQRTGTTPERLLEGYARVGEILKVGSAAVCAASSRITAFSKVSQYSDEMAKAGQIMDDLQDLGEDLDRERFNYVAAVIRTLRKHGQTGTTGKQAFLEGLLLLAAREKAVGRAKEHVLKALTIIGPLELPGMKKYMRERLEALASAEAEKP